MRVKHFWWNRKKSNICVTRSFSEFHVRLSTLLSSKLRKPWSWTFYGSIWNQTFYECVIFAGSAKSLYSL